MLLILFIIKVLLPCLLVCKPLRNMLYLAWLLFNLIRNPRGNQDRGTSPFPDSFHFAKSRTNPKHHRDWKIQTTSTKYWSRPRLSFLYSITLNSNLKTLAATSLQQIHGTVNSSIELLLTVFPKQSVTQLGWISVLISSQPTIRSKTETPPQKSISYSTKTQYSKKFRINIILKSS